MPDTISTEVELFQHQQPAPAAAPAIVTASAEMDSWVRVASDVIKLAGYICETHFVPKAYRGNAPATAAAILAGRELGLPPMTALRHVQVVEGSPSLSAEYKRARVLAAGHELDILELNTTRCRVTGRRRGSGKQPLEITFTIDDAKRAGLVKPRSAWETRPRRMLFARAATEVCDFLFADVTNGLPTTELLTDGEDELAGYAESPQQAPVQQDEPPPAQRTARRRRPPAQTPPPSPAASSGQHIAPQSSAVQTAPGDASLPPLPGEEEPADPTAGREQATPSPPSTSAPGDDRHRKLVGVVQAHFKRLGFADEDRDERLWAAGKLASVKDLESVNDLDPDELSMVADTLAKCRDRKRLETVLAAAGEGGGDG